MYTWVNDPKFKNLLKSAYLEFKHKKHNIKHRPVVKKSRAIGQFLLLLFLPASYVFPYADNIVLSEVYNFIWYYFPK